jgi:hypothetical protein
LRTRWTGTASIELPELQIPGAEFRIADTRM